jgi:hypothetical protein
MMNRQKQKDEFQATPVREGGNHSIWSNPQTGRKEAIPRHNEIKKYLAHSICRNLSVPIPPGN